jgi:hypothetical protein
MENVLNFNGYKDNIDTNTRTKGVREVCGITDSYRIYITATKCLWLMFYIAIIKFISRTSY